MQLGELQKDLANLPTDHTEIWVLSPDAADKQEKMRQDMDLDFPVLVDDDLAVTTAFGLLNDKGNLPHPAALTIDKDGVVTWMRVDENYRLRPSQEELRSALAGLGEDTSE